uniref:MFS domain-containing protein n=1 Tax=Steinernema glaseri TaxID=37863 RepID=A0A1I8AEA2_9BILA
MDTTLSCAASVGDVYPHRTRHSDPEGHQQLLDSPTSSSKSSLDMDARLDPDDALDALGSKNIYIWFLLISCSLVWGVGAPPMMSSAFITDSDTSHCAGVSNASDCTPTVSLRSEFKLFGENSSLADWTTSAFMIGNMIGGSALSHMADRVGRRPAVVLSTIGLGVVGCLSALSPNVYVFSVMRCFQGAFFTGSSLIGWVLAYECIPRPLRAYTTILFGSAWVAGYCALAPFAYVIHTWRWLMVASSIPALVVGVFYIFALPESFHFLVSQSDRVKTEKWMKNAEKYGSRKIPFSADKLIDNAEAMRKKNAIDEHKVSVIKELLERKIFLLYTFVLAYLWSCDTFVYYGLSLFSTRLAGNRYVNYMLSGLVELPAYGIAPILLDKWGRKPSVSIGHFLTGVAMITYLFIPSDELVLSLTFWLIAKFAISCSFVNIFVYGSEVFPTSIRNLCIGICAVVSKIGGNLAPHVRALEVIVPSLPTIFFASLAFVAGALTLLLPETRNRPLPASIHVTKANYTAVKRDSRTCNLWFKGNDVHSS